MDKPISEWKRRFRGMEPEQLRSAWEAKASQDLSWQEEVNFHVAVAERMKQLGNMAIDLDDDTRRELCREATKILARLQEHLTEKPEKLAEIEEIAGHSDAYYEKFGSRTARYYMYEQGVIDVLGDRLIG